MRAEWWGCGSLQRRLRGWEAGTSGEGKRWQCYPAPLRVQAQDRGLPDCALPQEALRAPGETELKVRPGWSSWPGLGVLGEGGLGWGGGGGHYECYVNYKEL